jgi:hypothetical protein
LLKTIHHIWGQQFGKKGKDLFDATIDDLIKVGWMQAMVAQK